MRFSLVLALVGVLISIGVDYYIYRAIRRIKRPRRQRLVQVGYVVAGAVQYTAMLAAVALPKESCGNSMLRAVMWFIFIFLSIFFPKLVYLLFDTVGRIPLIFKKTRWKVMSTTGAAVGCLLFMLMWWGALINRYRISETHIELSYSDLPAGFDGYKIAQISDLHVGTWGNDTTFLSRIVDRVNGLDADMIVFTGDIVNRSSDELEPMISTLGRLHARDGVIAILGNHDYGDYRRWPSQEAHIADRENLKRLYGMTDITLLLNETMTIKHGSDSIVVIGVENISDPPYVTYGNLAASYDDTSDTNFKVLLSHNPSHWVNEIKNNPVHNIALTLAGHTHAMQVQLADISPASLSTSTPWGLYCDNLGRSLYVNRGVGTVGMPMRIGATPEISIFTLHRK